MIAAAESAKSLDGEGDMAIAAASSFVGDANGNDNDGDDDDAENDANGKMGAEDGGDDVSNAKGQSGDACNNNYNNDYNADGRFDHTSRKVVVHNILKYIRHKELQKLVASWLVGHESKNIKIVATKKPPKDNWVKVTLSEESMVNTFIELINTGGEGGKAMLNGRGKPLFAKRADEMFVNGGDRRECGDSGDGQKRKERHPDGNDGGENGGERDTRNTKRFKSSPEIRILSSDEVRDAITPLWKMTYPQQLDSKMKEMVNKCAKTIVKEIKGKFKILEREAKRGQRNKNSIQLYDWLNQLRAIEIDQPIPSPLKYEYRNKCEFTIGYRLVSDDRGEREDNTLIPTTTGGEKDTVDVELTMRDGVTKEGDDGEDEKVAADDLNITTNPHTSIAMSSLSTSTSNAEFRKVPAAGFLAQGWNGGIYPPHPLQNMPDWSCGIADIFNEFLPTSSIPPYDSKAHRGVWRTVTVRCSLRTRECMVIVLHAPATGGAGARDDGSDDYTRTFDDEKVRLVGMLTKGAIPTPKRDFPEGHCNDTYTADISGAATPSSATGMNKSGSEEEKVEDNNNNDGGIRVTSIYFQEYDGLSLPTPDHPVQHIYGKKYIEEKLGKCTFQISPGAFFQTNTDGAEVLYSIIVERIREVTSDPQRTLLLDVCCGTGTIGLMCLKEGVVGALVGVDIAEPAIADARINAERNGFHDAEKAEESGVVTTTRFVASAAEKVMPEVMRDISLGGVRGMSTTTPVIVAVVDPARDGLHGIVVRTLRANEKIQRLIYVSCNPVGTLTRDAAMLCGPPTKKYPGRPFKPTRSQPVDMFPMTKHCEMVMTFDRMSKEEYEKYQA